MKSRLIVSIITVVLVVLSVSLLYAQDEELTLDGIAGQLSALTERVAEMFTAQADLTHRLAVVETAIAPTPTPTATAPKPTPTATATPTPGPEVLRLQFSDIKKDEMANPFAARKKYSEYDGKIVEVEGDIEMIGNDWDGEGLPYILFGFAPLVQCTLEEVEEDVLLGLRDGDRIVVMGEFTIADDVDAYLFVTMENCRIVPDEGTDPDQE